VPDPVKPTQTDFERYAKGAEEIQKSCACIRWDARECYEARNYPQRDDLDDGRPDWDDNDCSCSCHDELGQLEEDVYGPRDD
jgi:hypothetical protein